MLNKMFFRKNGSMRHLADVDEAATSPTGGPSTPPQQVYKMPNKKHSVSMGEAAESLRPKILTHKRSNTDISNRELLSNAAFAGEARFHKFLWRFDRLQQAAPVHQPISLPSPYSYISKAAQEHYQSRRFCDKRACAEADFS